MVAYCISATVSSAPSVCDSHATALLRCAHTRPQNLQLITDFIARSRDRIYLSSKFRVGRVDPYATSSVMCRSDVCGSQHSHIVTSRSPRRIPRDDENLPRIQVQVCCRSLGLFTAPAKNFTGSTRTGHRPSRSSFGRGYRTSAIFHGSAKQSAFVINSHGSPACRVSRVPCTCPCVNPPHTRTIF